MCVCVCVCCSLVSLSPECCCFLCVMYTTGLTLLSRLALLAHCWVTMFSLYRSNYSFACSPSDRNSACLISVFSVNQLRSNAAPLHPTHHPQKREREKSLFPYNLVCLYFFPLAFFFFLTYLFIFREKKSCKKTFQRTSAAEL